MRAGDKVRVIATVGEGFPACTGRTGTIVRQYAPGGSILGWYVRPDDPRPDDIFEVEGCWCWYTRDLELVNE
jgi:hypothetical protein